MPRIAVLLVVLSLAACPEDRRPAVQAQVARLLRVMDMPSDELKGPCQVDVPLRGPGTPAPNVEVMFACEPGCDSPATPKGTSQSVRPHLSFHSGLARFWELTRPGRGPPDPNEEPVRTLLPKVEALRYLVRFHNRWLGGFGTHRELVATLVDLDTGKAVCSITTGIVPREPACGDQLREAAREVVSRMGVRTSPEFWKTVTHNYPPDPPQSSDLMRE